MNRQMATLGGQLHTGKVPKIVSFLPKRGLGEQTPDPNVTTHPTPTRHHLRRTRTHARTHAYTHARTHAPVGAVYAAVQAHPLWDTVGTPFSTVTHANEEKHVLDSLPALDGPSLAIASLQLALPPTGYAWDRPTFHITKDNTDTRAVLESFNIHSYNFTGFRIKIYVGLQLVSSLFNYTPTSISLLIAL